MSGLSKNKIKWIRSLHSKKTRDELDVYLVEGEKMVKEAMLFSRDSIELILHTKDFLLQDESIESFEISETELSLISTLKSPNKAFAILKKNKIDFINTENKLIIALDGIQDPGNMGTILRIADWFGINDIICSISTVDCYNPKVVQASMGAIFRVNIHYIDLANWIINSQLPIYGAILNGENVYLKKLETKAVLLMGNEGNGISESLIPLITVPISIPRFGNAESLNVSIATGIIVSEFFRS